MGDVLFQLLAKASDECVGVLHDDDFTAAEHREAAELVQHSCQLGPLAVDINPLRSLRRALDDLGQPLQLKKRVGTDQRVDEFDRGRRGHWNASSMPAEPDVSNCKTNK